MEKRSKYDALSARYDDMHDSRARSDIRVAKAASISEVSQMAKAEGRLRDLLIMKWKLRSKEAIEKGALAARRGKSAEKISEAIDGVFKKYPADVRSGVKKSIDKIYRLARLAGYKKATGKISYSLAYNAPKPTSKTNMVLKAKGDASLRFDVKDTNAIELLAENQLFWIGEHYSEHVAAAIRSATSSIIVEAGGSAKKAGELIESMLKKELGRISIPGGFTGDSSDYYKGVAANAATTARAYGQLRSFAQIGVEKYIISNPDDDRTCPVCSHMNGKTFLVSDGADQISREMSAKTPEGVKSAHPWVNAKQLLSISATPGAIAGSAGLRDSARLAASGLALPGYHFRCRCAVDISLESMRYEDLSPGDVM